MRPADEAGKGRPAIVIPTIRDESFFINFLRNWKDEFAGCHLIVIEDRKKQSIE